MSKASSSTINVATSQTLKADQIDYELGEPNHREPEFVPAESPGVAPPTESMLRAPDTPLERLLLRARSRFPLVYHYSNRVYNYIRGPQPKKDLPGQS